MVANERISFHLRGGLFSKFGERTLTFKKSWLLFAASCDRSKPRGYLSQTLCQLFVVVLLVGVRDTECEVVDGDVQEAAVVWKIRF